MCIVSSDISEKVQALKLDPLYQAWDEKGAVIGATLEITSLCNLKCVHCYMGDLRQEEKQYSYEQIISIIDKMYDYGVLFLTFSGGEPFVRADFRDIYIYAKKKGFIVEIFTNGTLIDEQWVEIFKEYPPFLIDISIYGSSEETYFKVTQKQGKFKKFIKTLNLLKDAGIRTAIKAPVLSLNCQELEYMRNISETFSGENFRFSFDIVPDRSNKAEPQRFSVDPLAAVLLEIDNGSNYNSMSEVGREGSSWVKSHINDMLVPKYFCSIGKSTIHIDYNGNVKPCVECMDGYSIFEHDLNWIISEFSKIKEQKVTCDYKCAHCEALTLCKSCPQIRKRIYGDECIVQEQDCIMAKLKYMYYVEKVPVEVLRTYYEKFKKGGEMV